jgi:hypothetical protein
LTTRSCGPPGRKGALLRPSPGSRAALPPPRPLRTARESFPSCSSSLSNALCGTRFRTCVAFTIRTWNRRTFSVWKAAPTVLLFCRHLLCLHCRFAKFSRDERPDGSLPAFAWSHVPTPIHIITRWLSLFPPSHTHHPVGFPYG